MKRVMEAVTIDLESYVPGASLTFEMRDPGIIRQTPTQMVRKESLVATLANSNPKGPPDMIPVPTIIYEVDPDAPMRMRTFAALPDGKVLDSDADLVYQGTFYLPQGRLLFLFEEVPPEKRAQPDPMEKLLDRSGSFVPDALPSQMRSASGSLSDLLKDATPLKK